VLGTWNNGGNGRIFLGSHLMIYYEI